MITLALIGKLPVTEDPLTAALIDCLRYSSDSTLAREILTGAAASFAGEASLPDFDAYTIDAWPQLAGREPDGRIVMYKRGVSVCRLLIEAKLGACKSGAGSVDTELKRGDQLAYYLCAESTQYPNTRVALLYLTHHAAMPSAELRESADQLRSARRPDLVKELFWSSWRDVERRLANARRREQWLIDFGQLLRRAKMYRFDGFAITDLPPALSSLPTYYARDIAPAYPDPLDTIGPLSEGWSYERAHGRTYLLPAPPHASSFPEWYQENR